MPQDLPVGYYLDNFLTILDHVDSLYDDILIGEETAFSVSFRALSLAAQRLFVRLISRKGPFFRSGRLRYHEITDIRSAAEELPAEGFLAIDLNREIRCVVELMRRAEILDLLGRSGMVRQRVSSMRRPGLIDCVVHELHEDAVRGYAASLFHVYTPLREKEVELYRLLFFGNLHQDLIEFVLTDLGIVRYESYEIDKSDRMFRSREVLEATCRLIELRDAFHGASEAGDTAALLDIAE